MLRAYLYEELHKPDLNVLVCSKDSLREKLQLLESKLDLKIDTLIIHVCKYCFEIYHSERVSKDEQISIQLDSAVRFRIEIDLNEFEEQMKRVDEALIQYPFEVADDKYCEVRYMNLKDDFLILDVYIETKQTDQIDNGYNEAYT